MSKLQITLESLQPYVISIRYFKGSPVVDVILNDGWTTLNDAQIKNVKNEDDNSLNYYMVFSEIATVTLDDLLGYVDRVIKANIEREKKLDLLKNKVNELKDIFKTNSLNKLQKLRFSFGEDETFTTNLSDVDLSVPSSDITTTTLTNQPIINEVSQTNLFDEAEVTTEISEEDREFMEEEARGERNRRIAEEKKRLASTNTKLQKIELPPRSKPKMVLVSSYDNYDESCNCAEDEFCGKCAERKSL